MAGAVSKTYGHALVELAAANGTLDRLLEEAGAVRKVLADNPEVVKLYAHPKVTPEEKQAFTETVFSGRVSSDMTGLLVLAVRNGRAKEIPAMLDEIVRETKELKGIGCVQVITPIPLTPAQRAKVEAKILGTTKYRTLETVYETDASLIGGIVIRIGDRVVDGSIRTQLNEMSRELMQVSI